MSDTKSPPEVELATNADVVSGTLSLHVPVGTSSEARAKLVDDALGASLHDRAAEIGVVLAAAPSRFARERPGRDGVGRVVFDVSARIEGDRLVPHTRARSKRAERRT